LRRRLKVPYRKRKKPYRGMGTAVGALCPIVPNALWAMDFQFDVTVDGRTLKLFNIVDEYTRECPGDRRGPLHRVRPGLDHPTPTSTRIAAGPLIGARAEGSADR
jgi:hypothetical protein